MPPRKVGTGASSPAGKSNKVFSLKQLADHLGLAPTTVSLVMNHSPVAKTIAPETREAILEAARKFNYRPNFLARSLRTGRSFTIGVMVPEVSDAYTGTVMSGIEEHLLTEGYFYFVASHQFKQDLIDEYCQLFLDRSVDGLIVVCAPWTRDLPMPVVTVSSHHHVPGATSIVLDHQRAAEVALEHIMQLGHRRIAFIKGQSFVPDTEVRWRAIVEVAARLGVTVHRQLVTQIEGNSPSPALAYRVTRELLASGQRFSALFAFNDVCAIGAIHALQEFGLRVPEDVSVVGFDDIESAQYQTPGLTTVRQPLREMGRLAAETVMRRISRSLPESDGKPAYIVVEPQLVVRATTSPWCAQEAPAQAKTRGKSRRS